MARQGRQEAVAAVGSQPIRRRAENKLDAVLRWEAREFRLSRLPLMETHPWGRKERSARYQI